jgi:NAD(P)-dependent dehydrogenase (short-subunit alcohol dehydrogenase family)
VHLSARVGSVSDNRLGGWFSYRASKAALNQVVKTFDIHLQQKRVPAIAVGMHPGTVKTDLSKEFWGGVKEGKWFEPEFTAKSMVDVVNDLKVEQRGRIWDWEGKEVDP